jgi:hypothetical protein
MYGYVARYPSGPRALPAKQLFAGSNPARASKVRNSMGWSLHVWIGLLALFAVSTIICVVLLGAYVIPTMKSNTKSLEEIVQKTEQVCNLFRSDLEADQRLRATQLSWLKANGAKDDDPIVVVTRQRRIANDQDIATIHRLC